VRLSAKADYAIRATVDSLDEHFVRVVVGQDRQDDAVPPDELVAELRRLAHEPKHELIRRQLVEVARRADGVVKSEPTL
jgi:hypothetical protein